MNRRILVMLASSASGVAVSARAAPPSDVLPGLFEDGNLRIAISCAERFLTPDAGLRLTLDGAPLPALHANYVSSVSITADNTLVYGSAISDVGFLAPAGRHHLQIFGPDCTADDRDIDIPAAWPMRVRGRLEIANPELRGSTGAPDGLTLALGAFSAPYPAALRSGVTTIAPSAYTINATTTQGGWLSIGLERRHFVFATDLAMGWGALGGTVTTLPDPIFPTMPRGPFPFTGSFIDSSLTLRFGARIPLGQLSLAAGSGIGGTLWITTSSRVDTGTMSVLALAPEGASASWSIPVWTSALWKPSCNWGIEAVAATAVYPTRSDGIAIMGGATYQPSASCSEPVGVHVWP